LRVLRTLLNTLVGWKHPKPVGASTAAAAAAAAATAAAARATVREADVFTATPSSTTASVGHRLGATSGWRWTACAACSGRGCCWTGTAGCAQNIGHGHGEGGERRYGTAALKVPFLRHTVS
jgi:hypothetical protein